MSGKHLRLIKAMREAVAKEIGVTREDIAAHATKARTSRRYSAGWAAAQAKNTATKAPVRAPYYPRKITEDTPKPSLSANTKAVLRIRSALRVWKDMESNQHLPGRRFFAQGEPRSNQHLAGRRFFSSQGDKAVIAEALTEAEAVSAEACRSVTTNVAAVSPNAVLTQGLASLRPVFTAGGLPLPIYDVIGNAKPVYTVRGVAKPVYTVRGVAKPVYTARGVVSEETLSAEDAAEQFGLEEFEFWSEFGQNNFRNRVWSKPSAVTTVRNSNELNSVVVRNNIVGSPELGTAFLTEGSVLDRVRVSALRGDWKIGRCVNMDY